MSYSLALFFSLFPKPTSAPLSFLHFPRPFPDFLYSPLNPPLPFLSLWVPDPFLNLFNFFQTYLHLRPHPSSQKHELKSRCTPTADSFFTKPISLSATTNQTGNTQFSSRLSRSNLTRLLDNTPSITAFVPSNAAFVAAGNYTQTSARLASQLSNHIVTNQVLYLPRLVHGACYRTKAGNDITVTVKSGRYFINDAEIVQPDLILENGVAHIINKVMPFLFPLAFHPTDHVSCSDSARFFYNFITNNEYYK